jgi:tetraacyldisaccharide 4'-kinase
MGQALNIQASKRCVVVTGIGQSKPLLDYISEQSNVIQHFDFKDHFVYQKDTIDRIEKFARINQIETIVTTEKDWVKIKPLIQNSSMKWAYLPIEIHFNGEENLFKETILRTFVS